MKELGIHVTAYSPLGSEVKDQPSLLQDETLKKVCPDGLTYALCMQGG
jgi:diketogulonate reductase-like aldo/keto reductase